MIPEHFASGNDGYAFAPDGQLVDFSNILMDPLTDFGYSGGREQLEVRLGHLLKSGLNGK